MFTSEPNELTDVAQAFLEPANATHRQYEALRGTEQDFGSAFDHLEEGASTVPNPVSPSNARFKSVSFFVSFLVMR
jgi:hypothetical protein